MKSSLPVHCDCWEPAADCLASACMHCSCLEQHQWLPCILTLIGGLGSTHQSLTASTTTRRERVDPRRAAARPRLPRPEEALPAPGGQLWRRLVPPAKGLHLFPRRHPVSFHVGCCEPLLLGRDTALHAVRTARSPARPALPQSPLPAVSPLAPPAPQHDHQLHR